MQEGKSQRQQAQLLSAEHPAVQPAWEAAVFGASVELQDSSDDAGEVDQGEQHEGRYGKDPIGDGDGHAKRAVLLFIDVRVDDISDNTVDKEEAAQESGQVEGELPHWKQLQGVVFDFTGCRERALIQRSQSKGADNVHHSLLGFAVIPTDEHLR